MVGLPFIFSLKQSLIVAPRGENVYPRVEPGMEAGRIRYAVPPSNY